MLTRQLLPSTIGTSGASHVPATEYMTGRVHWTHYTPPQSRADATKTLVLVHGAGHNELVWTFGQYNLVGLFTELGHDVITVSLSGHRPSGGHVTIQTLRHYEKDAYLPVEVLGLDDQNVVFIGHSMGGIVSQGVLARHPRIAGVVIVDCVATHHALDTYMPVMQRLFRRHPRAALKAMISPAAMFGSDSLVRELLLGEDASDALVAELRPHLGGETATAMLEMLAAKLRGRQPLGGQKLLFLSARQSAFYPSAVVEASAREYGARCECLDGPHNLMMREGSAKLAAQIIAEWIARLPTLPPEARAVRGGDVW